MTTNKKQVLKRLLSLTLAVVMCFGFLPVPAQAASEATLTNGMPVTEENVLALIEEYRNGTREPGEKAKTAGFTSYTNGATYDPYNPKYRAVLPDGPINGTECAKFAFAFSDDIFGDAPYREVTDPWQIRPGDLIHFPSHWCIAVQSAYQEPGRDYPLTQTAGGGKAGSIGWGPNAIRGYTTLYTRYPLPYEFDDSEVHLTAEAPIGSPSPPSTVLALSDCGLRRMGRPRTSTCPSSGIRTPTTPGQTMSRPLRVSWTSPAILSWQEPPSPPLPQPSP